MKQKDYSLKWRDNIGHKMLKELPIEVENIQANDQDVNKKKIKQKNNIQKILDDILK